MAEVQRAVAPLLGRQRANSHGRLHAALTPAIDGFAALEDEEKDRFHDALARFTHTYSFLSQIVSFTDVKLEADYLFCRALATFIRSAGEAGLDLGKEVELTHLRTEQQFSGSLALDAEHDEVSTFFSGAGRQAMPEEESLSQIIAKLNERFSTEWSERDRIHLDAIFDDLTSRPDIQRAAAVNTSENFKLVIEQEFVKAIVAQNELG